MRLLLNWVSERIGRVDCRPRSAGNLCQWPSGSFDCRARDRLHQRNHRSAAENPHLPLTLLTLGLFSFVINALMLELASALLTPGFQVRTFTAAFLGAIVLSLVNMVLKWLVSPPSDRN